MHEFEPEDQIVHKLDQNDLRELHNMHHFGVERTLFLTRNINFQSNQGGTYGMWLEDVGEINLLILHPLCMKVLNFMKMRIGRDWLLIGHTIDKGCTSL